MHTLRWIIPTASLTLLIAGCSAPTDSDAGDARTTLTDTVMADSFAGDVVTIDSPNPVANDVVVDAPNPITADVATDAPALDVATDRPNVVVPDSGRTACAVSNGICVPAMRSNLGVPGFMAMCPPPRLLPNGQPSFFGPGNDLIPDTLRLGCPISAGAGGEASFEVCCLPGR